MIDQKTFVEALKFVAVASGKKDVRYYLNGVCFELRPTSLTLIATNGHQMAVAEIAGEFGDVHADVTVKNDDVKTILALFKGNGFKGFQVAPLAVGLWLTLTDVNGRGLTVEGVEAKYPDWRRVSPSGKVSTDMGRFAINSDYLAAGAKACGALANSKVSAVVVEVYGNNAHGGIKMQPQAISSNLPGLIDAWLYVMLCKL